MVEEVFERGVDSLRGVQGITVGGAGRDPRLGDRPRGSVLVDLDVRVVVVLVVVQQACAVLNPLRGVPEVLSLWGSNL